jgi:hypothetical protein
LAGTPDKKQERSDPWTHFKDERQDAMTRRQEEKEFLVCLFLSPRLGVLAFNLLPSRKDRCALA